MHPNPIKARKCFQQLDRWEFSFDQKVWTPIRVPFCPESKLSGIGRTDFIAECYYKTKFVPERTGERTVLHFGAVDYRAEVFVNGKHVGGHIGGYTPFELDITDFTNGEETEILLAVYDNEKRSHCHGKQSYKKQSFGCFYTRTTGIWQPVWIEYLPQKYIRDFYFYPNPEKGTVEVELLTNGCGAYSVEIFLDGQKVGGAAANLEYKTRVEIGLSQIRLWELGKGNLYDVTLSFEKDVVHSYFGLRSVKYEGYKFLLNGKETFQRLVLDQGYYPDGIYTAPSTEAMRKDIRIALEVGFNGARLHQKLFDPEFLYWCDKEGYMVWGEYPSWGVDYSSLCDLGQFLSEWEEALRRDFNHPSIVTWCPLNEVWGDWKDSKKRPDIRFVDSVYAFTKRFDHTRPCVDVSGGEHGEETDLFDFHCYQTADVLKEELEKWEKTGTLVGSHVNIGSNSRKYRLGEPVNVSEFGGIALSAELEEDKEVSMEGEAAVQKETAWGYGKGEADSETFVRRFCELVETVAAFKNVSGYCYTQLYDVEQEQNGLYTYERKNKLTEKQKEKIRLTQLKRN